jgi:hypothetical protein
MSPSPLERGWGEVYNTARKTSVTGKMRSILTNNPTKQEKRILSALSSRLNAQNPIAIKNPTSGNNTQKI